MFLSLIPPLTKLWYVNYIISARHAELYFQNFYHPDNDVAPLQGKRIVPVGYGNHGGKPFRFKKDEVAFFKIFVTSKYVDMTSLNQDSIFSEVSRIPQREPFQVHQPEYWDSWIYVVGD